MARRRTALFADGKAVWFWHPLLVLNLRRRVGPTGLGQTFNPQMTVARRIRRRGEHGISRKTIARGMPGDFRCTCGDYARVLCFISHARLRVQRAPGIPCALCLSRRERFLQNSGESRRGIAESYLNNLRHCEERLVRRSSTSEGGSDEAIHLATLPCFWTAWRSLSSGARSRVPLARNDGFRVGCLKIESGVKARRAFAIRITSPRLRGEVEAEGFGRGGLSASLDVWRVPLTPTLSPQAGRAFIPNSATPRPRRSRLRRCRSRSSPAPPPAPKCFRQRTAPAWHSARDRRLLHRDRARRAPRRRACSRQASIRTAAGKVSRPPARRSARKRRAPAATGWCARARQARRAVLRPTCRRPDRWRSRRA